MSAATGAAAKCAPDENMTWEQVSDFLIYLAQAAWRQEEGCIARPEDALG